VVDVSQTEKAADELPPESEGDWAAERFVVVPWAPLRPGASVSLRSWKQRFLQMNKSGAVRTTAIEDPPADGRLWERFTVVDAGDGLIALYNVENRRFVRMCSGQVDGGGGQVDKLPADWRSERFRVVDAGNGKIALHSGTERRFLRAEARNRSLGVVDVSQTEKAADELPPESEGDWAAERFVVVPWAPVRPKLAIGF
jgi:hypothetical protein